MIVGIPREIKDGEFRVSLTPDGAAVLTARGHQVLVETSAGRASGMSDEDYVRAGARILPDMPSVYRQAEMIVKVKEILPPEYPLLRDGQIIFTYIHSANKPQQTQVLLDSNVVAIAYENVRTDNGRFPLLDVMSEIAGEVGLLLGAYQMFTVSGGNGLLLGGAPGVLPAKVAVLGAGNVGLAAAKRALGLGAEVTVLDVNLDQLRKVRQHILPDVKTVYCNQANVERLLPEVDLLVNAVKWSPGLTIVSRPMLKLMKRGSLIVDIDCEPRGAIETCDYTTHANPVFELDGVRHLCIANLPSAVAATASRSLVNATFRYVLELAEKGWLRALQDNAPLRRGLSFAKGFLTFMPTAEAQKRPYTTPEEALRRLQT